MKVIEQLRKGQVWIFVKIVTTEYTHCLII